jgi:hypothetical protein
MKKKETDMALQTYVEEKQNRRGKLLIGFNKKLNRISLHKTSKDLLARSYGPFNCVLIKFDPEVKNSFWLAPCSEKELGAKKVNKTYVSISEALSKKMGLDSIKKESGSLPVYWDSKNNAVKIDVVSL